MKIKAIAILILFCLSFYLCKKSCPPCPETPEPPKPRATITIEVAKWPLDVSWLWWETYNYITIYVDVIITEGNGVGANVSSIRVKLYYGDKKKADEAQEGGRLKPFGSLTAYFVLRVYGPDPEHKVDKLTIEVKGGDDNGYAFTETISHNLSWGDGLGIR